MSAAVATRRGFALPGQGKGEEPEWTVLLTVAVALVLGMVLQVTVMGASRSTQVAGMTLSYPAGWSRTSDAGALFAARDLFGGASAARVSVHEVGVAPNAELGTAAGAWTVALADRHLGFHALSTARETVDGKPATSVEYAYVLAQAGSAPVVMRGIDTVASSGGKWYALSFVAPQDRFDDLATRRLPRFSSTLHDILGSWRLP